MSVEITNEYGHVTISKKSFQQLLEAQQPNAMVLLEWPPKINSEMVFQRY